MLTEDDNPWGKTAGSGTKPKNLDPLSVEELGEYINVLRAEIARAEAEITKKTATRAAAEAIFNNK